MGASYIIGVGDYAPVYIDGGSVWVQDRGALDCHNKWVEFDGNIPHATILPYKGTRYTLVYYTSGGYDRLGETVADHLARKGSMKGLPQRLRCNTKSLHNRQTAHTCGSP
jgi:hypothetical protein